MSAQPVSLGRLVGSGPLWGVASEDLNATLLAWEEGSGVGEHVNAELDVLVVVLGGAGVATVDGVRHPLATGDVLVIPKGARRALDAGAGGVRYLSIHRRRGLRIESAR